MNLTYPFGDGSLKEAIMSLLKETDEPDKIMIPAKGRASDEQTVKKSRILPHLTPQE
jgi:hypothetical protein